MGVSSRLARQMNIASGHTRRKNLATVSTTRRAVAAVRMADARRKNGRFKPDVTDELSFLSKRILILRMPSARSDPASQRPTDENPTDAPDRSEAMPHACR